MFFNLFKKKNDTHEVASKLFQAAIDAVRKEVFYEVYGVPDSFDGRFDLLLLHIFIVMHPLIGTEEGDKLSQELFDTTFRNMDQTLREMGIGDMGIPKHMKRMMKGFNGRMHSYQLAIAPDSLTDKKASHIEVITPEQAVRNNLFGTSSDEDLDDHFVSKMSAYLMRNIDALDDAMIDEIKRGHIAFVE